MYIKFIITGALDPNFYGGKYYNLNGFKFYDINNNVISGLNSIDNLISQTYNIRNAQSNTDAWFSPIIGERLVPYNGSSNITKAIIIVRIEGNDINKIDLYPYCNNGGGKYVDIYYSGDNVNYKYLEQITFLNVSTIISTTKNIVLGKYLVKQNNQYYSIKPDFYSNGNFIPLTLAGVDTPNDDDFNNNGIDDINNLCAKYNTEKYISNEETLGDGKLFTFNVPN